MFVMAWLMGAVAVDAPAPLPAWMAGCWIEERDERWMEECWTDARGGIMLGSGRSGRGERATSWETMEIFPADPAATPARLVYWGAPRGQGRTAFAWNGKAEEGAITFENAAHDYSQRIRYWREGDWLNAEISLADGSKANRWRYRRR